MGNIGRNGSYTTLLHIQIFNSRDILLRFKDGIRGIYIPINNNNLMDMNISKKFEVKYSQNERK